MRLIRAKNLGFCSGVKGAVALAEETRKNLSPERPLYTCGSLIHNGFEIQRLKYLGISPLSVDEIFAGTASRETVIVSAHGARKSIYDALANQKATIVDGTCPHVLQSRKEILAANNEGRCVIIVGDPAHSEVIGLKSFAATSFVLSTKKEAAAIAMPPLATIIAQTTWSLSGYSEICKIITAKGESVKVCDTVCPATLKRQQALRTLMEECDGIVVVGGRESANTRELFSIASTGGKPAWLCEAPEDLPSPFPSLECVGLTAGASAPEPLIAAMEEELYKYCD